MDQNISGFELNNKIYFRASALGLMPRRAFEICDSIYKSWQERGLYGMFECGWVHCEDPVRNQLSQILGCSFEEIALPGQHIFNLHQILTKMYDPLKDGKKEIVIDSPLVWTLDENALRSFLQNHRIEPSYLKVIKGNTLYTTEEDILDYVNTNHDKIQLIILQTINPVTGYAYDIQRVVNGIKKHEIIIGLDITQSAGIEKLNMKCLDIDFGIFSTGSYLSGGENSISGIYWNKKNFKIYKNQLSGWFGNNHSTQFLMRQEFEPNSTASMLMTSGLSPFCLQIQQESLDQIIKKGVDIIQNESIGLAKILYSELMKEQNIKMITPLKNLKNIISFRHDRAIEIQQKLKDLNIEVIVDAQQNILVVSLYSLYNNEQDVNYLIEKLKELQI